MGKDNEIIVHEKVTDSERNTSGTKVSLSSIKHIPLDKKLATIARNLVEKLLPYFIAQNYTCPEIILTEENISEPIVLNNYIGGASSLIKELKIPESSFSLGQGEGAYDFKVRIFKVYSPKNQTSKISLVADKREVIDTPIHNYIPEFIDGFYERGDEENNIYGKNYIIKSYVFSDYLNKHVSLERGGFEFQKDNDLLYGISQSDIESSAAELTKKSVIDDISPRIEKKKNHIISYVEREAPWHKNIVNAIDLTGFPYNADDEQIESLLQAEKFHQEVLIKNDLKSILTNDNVEKFKEDVSKVVEKISESSKNDLIHYIALRKKILEIFKKSLEVKIEGEYSSEGIVHDIIFPTKRDSEITNYDHHNLWIIDERLIFTHYIASELPLNGGRTERPDLLVCGSRVAFRGDNESSNPVTIFEFKRPGRDDFVNPSSKEDPIQQTIRYVNNIRSGKFKTPEGRKINIDTNTPFYGYVVCELSQKVETWLEEEKDFKVMPDRMGWFKWIENINLYIEVLSWDKLLKDADMRNRIFFQKLGI